MKYKVNSYMNIIWLILELQSKLWAVMFDSQRCKGGCCAGPFSPKSWLQIKFKLHSSIIPLQLYDFVDAIPTRRIEDANFNYIYYSFSYEYIANFVIYN